MPYFQDRWEALTEKVRKILQVAFAVVIAASSIFFLAVSSEKNTGGFLDPYLFACLGIALGIPNIIETQVGNKLPFMRKIMIIALVICLAIFFIYTSLLKKA